jgi:hypothetical protein
MLKLVESLATKAERAKSTTVEFSPLISEAYARKCDWCERFTTSPKGWVSYRAVEKTNVAASTSPVIFASTRNAASAFRRATAQPLRANERGFRVVDFVKTWRAAAQRAAAPHLF